MWPQAAELKRESRGSPESVSTKESDSGTLPCPVCSYRACSILDLELHGGNTHRVPESTSPSLHSRIRQELSRPVHLPALQWTRGPEVKNPLLSVPEADPDFWVDYKVGNFLFVIGKRSQQKEIVNVLLLGPTGTGKSSLPKEFAAAWGRPLCVVHCQLVAEPGDWWGSKEMSPKQGTYFQETPLVDAVETPGCIILLDEANRTHPENLNALFGLLDQRRRAWVPALNRELVVALGVIFFVTLNEGMDYVGTNPVDRALRDRISNTIRMGFPPEDVELEILVNRIRIDQEMAGKLVKFAHMIRSNPKTDVEVSTRRLLECASLIKEGLPLDDAILFGVVNGTPEKVDQKTLLQALQVAVGSCGQSVQTQWDDDE